MITDEKNKRRYIFSDAVVTLYHKHIDELREKYLDYMSSEIEFKNSRLDDDGYTVLDLRKNGLVHYKSTGLTLLQCPLFETEHSYRFYKSLVPDYDFTDKVVFDCGACCGLDAILFSKEARHVVCLEPDEKNFQNLSINTGDYKNITIVNKALFNHTGFIEFSCENTQGSMILGKTIDIPVEDLKKIRKAETTQVKCTTLNRMMSKYGRPDVVKIDIEGAEYDLVCNDSMKDVLEAGSILIFEIHQLPKSTDHFSKLVSYIESFGYTVTHTDDPLLGYHICCVKG